jgi:Glyoxalase-like domain
VRIDHVMLAADDLEATAARLLETYGLSSIAGGTHPQWGTANRIVPLGGPYLEIISIADAARAAQTPFGQWLAARTADGAVLCGVMVEPDDFDAVCARLSLTPAPAQRSRPDGTTLAWRLAGMTEAMSRTWPCFISWDRREEAFGGDAGVGATGIAQLEIGGAPEAITAWLGGPVGGLGLVGGSPGIRQVTISTGAGDIVLPHRP